MIREIPEQKKIELDENIINNLEEDWRDIFRSAENPVEVLLLDIESDEFRNKVPEEVLSSITKQFKSLTYEDEDDFVNKARDIMRPVFEITARCRLNTLDQKNRNMFNEIDMEKTIALIKQNGSEKIYVVGNKGSGKTTFSREFARSLGYKNIDLDVWHLIFRQEKEREAKNLKKLLEFVFQKEKPPFVINHAELLIQDSIKEADMVIYLNPKQEEQLRTRKLRGEKDTDEEWQGILEGYDHIIRENSSNFKNLGGVGAYNNQKSGTSIRLLGEKI